MVIESLVGYSSLAWHLCSLRVYLTSVQDLLAFIVSVEKSGVILIGLPLYFTLPFSYNLLISFLFLCAFGILILLLGGISFLV